MTDTFLNGKELTISIIQGIVITLGILVAYQWAVQNGGSEEKTRAIVFATLVFANIFKFYQSLFLLQYF
jgi:Ca2+-transporting ATPase